MKVRARRTAQRPLVDGFLWLIRIAALVAIVVGSFRSLTGRGLVTLSAAQWRDNIVSGLSLGSIYALIALGYTMVYGVLRFINFAHGEVFMIGAFCGYYLTPRLLPHFTGWMTPLGPLAVLVLTMVICALLGITIEKLAYRPLRQRPNL